MTIEITLGQRFAISPDTPYCQGSIWKKLIYLDNRPVGFIASGNYAGKHILWLQNYAGYQSSEFFLSFSSEEVAVNRAKKILTEWMRTGIRATWVA